MNPLRRWLNAPHLVLALVLTGSVLGITAVMRMPSNLFPDSERPQAAVVTVWPGAAAEDVEAEVSRILESELAGLGLVRQVVSTSRDEVSAVTVEFEYGKGLEIAASEAAATVNRVLPALPAGARAPMVFSISSATPAALTLALAPGEGSPLDLSMVRQLADNEIRTALLQIPAVAGVEVFGGHRPVALVEPDPVMLAAHGLTGQDVVAALSGGARNQPVGTVRAGGAEHLVLRLDARATESELAEVVVAGRGEGVVRLSDVADIRRGTEEPTAAFHAQGTPAIALAIQRSTGGHALETARAVAAALPGLEADFPGIAFSIPDTQAELIEQSMSNMKGSLVGAIIPTMLVLFLFLGDRRVTLLAAVSLPLTFLLTFAFMGLLGMEFNLITLTAIIVAVGLLVDNSVVVIENTARHMEQRSGGDLRALAVDAVSEVALPILGGTLTTVMVLLPVMFAGGFVQTILRPFAVTLALAIVNSYLVAVSVIPLLAPLVLRPRSKRQGLDERWARKIGDGIVRQVSDRASAASRWALSHRGLTLLVAVVVMALTWRLVPVLGRDLLPPMDTGILKVSFEAEPNATLERAEQLMGAMEAVILERPEVTSVASALGSEPGVMSFGAAATPRQGLITIHMVNRFQRDTSIWDIAGELQARLGRLPGLAKVRVFEHGSTPMSSIAAAVDVEITGPDPDVLDRLAGEVEDRLRRNVPGLTSTSQSWRFSSQRLELQVDAERAAQIGITSAAISEQVAALLRGAPAATLRQPAQRGLPVVLRLHEGERAGAEALAGLPIMTPTGVVPLGAVAEFAPRWAADAITRRDLERSINVTATRGLRSITHLQSDIDAALADLSLPAGYRIHHRGEIGQMWESFGRLGGALVLSLILLYGTLIPTFRSWIHPVTILTAVPLAAVGGVLALAVVGKTLSMAAFMGIILLGGVAVNTSILLLDVYRTSRQQGLATEEAVERAIRLRTRPILITTLSTMVGMLPVALELAIGLERLSPLAIVAIGGLWVSALAVLVVVPAVASLLEDAGKALVRLTHPGRTPRPAGEATG